MTRTLPQIIDRIISRVGRRIDESPMVDALAGRSRPAIIRRWPSMAQCCPFGASGVALSTIWCASTRSLRGCRDARHGHGRLNILISGGTGSGKTTLLSFHVLIHPDNRRIITIEDSAELQLQQPRVVGWSPPPNVEGAARSNSATWCATACGCARIALSSVRSAAARSSTCSGHEHRPRRLDFHRARQLGA
jgi:pilus assembly protein CpaF